MVGVLTFSNNSKVRRLEVKFFVLRDNIKLFNLSQILCRSETFLSYFSHSSHLWGYQQTFKLFLQKCSVASFNPINFPLLSEESILHFTHICVIFYISIWKKYCPNENLSGWLKSSRKWIRHSAQMKVYSTVTWKSSTSLSIV